MDTELIATARDKVIQPWSNYGASGNLSLSPYIGGTDGMMTTYVGPTNDSITYTASNMLAQVE